MMNFFQKKIKNRRGFTMIEIIAVLVILAILIAVAVSSLVSSGNELIMERDLLKSNLRYAQFKALSNNDSAATNWGIQFSGGSYTLQKNGSASTVNFPSDNSPTHSLTGGVTVTAPASVAFDFWGSPGTSDITVTLAQGGQTTSFTITRTTGYMP